MGEGGSGSPYTTTLPLVVVTEVTINRRGSAPSVIRSVTVSTRVTINTLNTTELHYLVYILIFSRIHISKNIVWNSQWSFVNGVFTPTF